MREMPDLWLEISHLEYVDGLGRFVRDWGTERLLFGTHAPLFTPTAAAFKLKYSTLTPSERTAIAEENPRTLFLPRSSPACVG